MLPFWGKNAPGIFHGITLAVKHIMIRQGYGLILVYLNDFLINGNSKDECQAAYDCLGALLLDLGYELSKTKFASYTVY